MSTNENEVADVVRRRTEEIVAIRLPVELSALNVITDAVITKYGRGCKMRWESTHLIFEREVS